MPKPISRREILRRFKTLGWSGPYAGGNHMFMRKDNLIVRIPNPHGNDIDWSLMKRILAQADITTGQWDATDGP
jgi:predicted RNA binding protein YcfA (HicA-like mRNA interferase family)